MKALAIHGHFYQPPRENPLTGKVPAEPSAAPYDNWNQRIHAECYQPNARLGNFETLSFNIGPTLATWIAAEDPEVMEQIAAGDRACREEWGEGNALAQPYHHTILPLATRREKEMEVAWGLADFRHRFGRAPRGIWLPEAAADSETLSVVAQAGLEFTLLAPWQLHRTKPDVTRPYQVELPEDRRITVFPYHGELSSRISFVPEATNDADRFAQELAATMVGKGDREDDGRLLLLASDGELYGHHQQFRDLFLARLLGSSARSAGFTMMPLARFLDLYPPRRSAELAEPSSWSCHHGVDRWTRACGCAMEAAWKTPLRRALRRLATELDGLWEEVAAPLLHDPWALLRKSAQAVLGAEPLEILLAEEARQVLSAEEIRRLSLLVAAQWQRHRMFASCGWFWEDFDRLEPRINLASAALATEYARQATGADLVPFLLPDLSLVISARTGVTGREVFTAHLARFREAPVMA